MITLRLAAVARFVKLLGMKAPPVQQGMPCLLPEACTSVLRTTSFDEQLNGSNVKCMLVVFDTQKSLSCWKIENPISYSLCDRLLSLL